MPRVRDQSMEVKFQAGEAPRPVASGRAADVLNSLLRGELAAIETYRQAIEKDGPDAASLASLRDEHADSATPPTPPSSTQPAHPACASTTSATPTPAT